MGLDYSTKEVTLVALFIALTLTGIGSAEAATGASQLRLNQIQLVGVHNSYHVQPMKKLLDLALRLSDSFQGWQYTHQPIPTLLQKGVRSFEFDVFPDPKGGLYYNRDGMRLIDLPTASKIPALKRPGYKVLHVQDVDFRATCLTFVECLKQLNAWSVKNPGHLPITVKVEVKYSSLVDEIGSIAAMILPNASTPPEITPALLTDLEKEVLSVIPRWKILKPDNVRGNYPTLAGAVKTKGWPSVAVASGKFMFVLVGGAIDTYKQNAPSLQGKLFFTGPTYGGTPDAAVVSMEVDYTSAKEDVQKLLKQNVIVWTRADADTVQARTNDGTRRQVALTSGAQIVHTDYPAAERPNPFGTPYFVALPLGRKAMCNPVTAPSWCRHYFLNEPVKA